jgi:hypothetical protein
MPAFAGPRWARPGYNHDFSRRVVKKNLHSCCNFHHLLRRKLISLHGSHNLVSSTTHSHGLTHRLLPHSSLSSTPMLPIAARSTMPPPSICPGTYQGAYACLVPAALVHRIGNRQWQQWRRIGEYSSM